MKFETKIGNIEQIEKKTKQKNEECPIINIEINEAVGHGKKEIAAEIRKALETWGGFICEGHGVDGDLRQKIFELSKAFFELPQEVKDSVHLCKGGAAWRGYMPHGGERSENGKIEDLKEGLYLGEEHPSTHSYVIAQFPTWGKNILPDAELPEFRDVIAKYICALTELGDRMMEFISISLGLDAKYINKNITLGEPVVLPRIFNYPAKKQRTGEHSIDNDKDNFTAGKETKESWGIGDHTDYGLWTMILTNAPGLEVMHPFQQKMVPVPFHPNGFFMNAGDVLDRLSKGIFKSPRHRARNTNVDGAGGARISIPFFYDPAWTARMLNLPMDEVIVHESIDIKEVAKRWECSKIRCNFDGSVEYSEFLAKKVSKVFPDLVPKKLMQNLESTSSPSTRHHIVIELPEKRFQAALTDTIEDDRQKVLKHPVYSKLISCSREGTNPASEVDKIKSIHKFMEHHVWAVFDYFQLLKRLQMHFTCVTLPWHPTKDARMRHFITEIVAEEECDECEDGITHQSHLEMYIRGMDQAGANTKPIKKFLRMLDDNAERGSTYDLGPASLDAWLCEGLITCGAPGAAVAHVAATMKLAREGKIWEVASVFTFGREDIIPKVFISILNNGCLSCKKLSIFRYYLERHIELDGKDHAPLAIALVNRVCESDAGKWDEAASAVKKALCNRASLWSAVESAL